MQALVIRHYDGNYDEEIIDNILSIQSGEFGIPITKADQPDICAIKDFYLQGKGTFLIALYDGKVVGTLGLLDIGQDQFALRKMFVNKAFRGQPFAVAKQLLTEALQWSREKEIKNIFLGTTALFLSAHRFYEKNGFYRVDKTALPEAFPIMQVDTIFYRLDL